ncbi:MAG: Na/Pi symporter [Weeksellaceae bacterium]|nr:Na/Pi symporter [Weeksellaceae bacterium]
MSWLLIFNSFGAVALFLFGMKLMSESLQRISGSKIRKMLTTLTDNKWRAFLAGVGITAIMQSSSAVSVLTLSVVSAGLLKIRRAFTIILGANVGTTFTLWIVALGLEINFSQLALPLIALAIPMYFGFSSKYKDLATFLIGFSLIFVGLHFLKDNFVNYAENSDVLTHLAGFQNLPFGIDFIFILAGFIITVMVTSSSASTSIITILFGLGLPLDLCLMMVMGANIGTTITAQIAALVGNAYARLTAHFHTFFNVFATILFFFFIPFIEQILIFLTPTQDKFLMLSAFHTMFNLIPALLIMPFLNFIAQRSLAWVRPQETDNKNFKIYSTSITVQPEVYLYESQNKIIHLAGNIKQIIGLLGRLITESDDEKFDSLHNRIKTLEDEADIMESEIRNYLNHFYTLDVSPSTSKIVHQLINVSQELEYIADLSLKISYLHKERRESQSFITPKLRTYLIEIQDAVSNSAAYLFHFINDPQDVQQVERMRLLEERIDEVYNQAMAHLTQSLEKDKLKSTSALYYRDIIQNYEQLSDYIYRAHLALNR